MADKTLTAANSVILLGVTGLFDTPVQLQGFAADEVYETEGVDSSETVMGVDGVFSAGWIPMAIKQNITLQADSDSIFIFENWYQAQQSIREIYRAFSTILLPSLQRKYTLTRGVLKTVPVTPSAKKIMQPRRFTVEWERVTSAPF